MSKQTTHPTLTALATALAVLSALLVAAAWAMLRFVLAGAPAPTLPSPWPGIFAVTAAAALVAAPLVEGRLIGTVPTPAAYTRAKTVGFALRALVAFNGFLLALGTGRLAWSFALSTAALIAMALAWPRAADLEPPPENPE